MIENKKTKELINYKKNFKLNKNHESFDYLKKEIVRLKKMETLYSTKLKNLRNYPQLPPLKEEQREERNKVKKELLKIVKSKNSIFYHFLKREFDRTFSSSKKLS